MKQQKQRCGTSPNSLKAPPKNNLIYTNKFTPEYFLHFFPVTQASTWMTEQFSLQAFISEREHQSQKLHLKLSEPSNYMDYMKRRRNSGKLASRRYSLELWPRMCYCHGALAIGGFLRQSEPPTQRIRFQMYQ